MLSGSDRSFCVGTGHADGGYSPPSLLLRRGNGAFAGGLRRCQRHVHDCRFGTGYDDPKAQQEKKEHYALIQRLAEAFREENGSIVCRELLGLEHKKDDPTPAVRTAEYYRKRPCSEMVKSAVSILEKELYE